MDGEGGGEDGMVVENRDASSYTWVLVSVDPLLQLIIMYTECQYYVDVVDVRLSERCCK